MTKDEALEVWFAATDPDGNYLFEDFNRWWNERVEKLAKEAEHD